MIQAVQTSDFNAYLDLADNRISGADVPQSQIRHLWKFSNDYDKAVFYAYPFAETHYAERYVRSYFIWNATPNMFAGQLNLKPAGYFKYEVYEVAWPEDEVGWCTVILDSDNAPETENEKGSGCFGVVKGLIAIGKLYLAETLGNEEVQYLEHPEPAGTNYIYTS